MICKDHKGHAKQVLPDRLYAGASLDKTLVPRGATIIDLIGDFRPSVLAFGISLPGLSSPYIRIEWKDQGVPNINAKEWATIARATRTHKVFVGCAGGHGRTGTALAILLHMWKAYPAPDTDPVKWVRENYCIDAVETSGQIAYVQEITGRVTTCEPSNTFKFKGFKTTSTLCPCKVGSHYCNLDTGHKGDHDARKRSELVEAGLCGGPAWTLPEDASYKNKKIVYCIKSMRCLLRDNHKGPCNNALTMDNK